MGRAKMSDQNDSLIAQLGEGGKRAEEAFVSLDTQYRSIMHIILSKQFSIHDSSTREDIIQNTFISVFQKSESFKGNSSDKTWIISILKNKAIDYLRKKQKEESIIDNHLPDPPQTLGFDDPPPIDDCVVQAIEAFRKENPKYYSQLMQIAWNGISLKQLATLENIKHGAARERISSYRKKLRTYINRLCEEQH